MISYETLQSRIIAACQESKAIRALLLVGSRARKDRPLDNHADLDYILLTPEPDAVKTMPAWIETVANIWVPDYSYTGPGDPEWEVIYEGGFKVDFTFHYIEPEETLQNRLEQMPYQAVLLRGFQVLIDKTQSQGHITWSFKKDNRQLHLTGQVFKTAVNNFLLEAARAARFIDRGDLWRAKMACDADLKHLLLTMIEWQARAKNGRDYDTWYDGRYLSEWADPDIVAALPATFAAYDTADLRFAFQATLALYHQLAAETAAAFNYPYPTPGQQSTLLWLQQHFPSNP
jgi:aminoglycoside 6-adenylyltransferase